MSARDLFFKKVLSENVIAGFLNGEPLLITDRNPYLEVTGSVIEHEYGQLENQIIPPEEVEAIKNQIIRNNEFNPEVSFVEINDVPSLIRVISLVEERKSQLKQNVPITSTLVIMLTRLEFTDTDGIQEILNANRIGFLKGQAYRHRKLRIRFIDFTSSEGCRIIPLTVFRSDDGPTVWDVNGSSGSFTWEPPLNSE